jgi:hypothetical protein
MQWNIPVVRLHRRHKATAEHIGHSGATLSVWVDINGAQQRTRGAEVLEGGVIRNIFSQQFVITYSSY